MTEVSGGLLEGAMPNQCHPALAEIADLVRPAFGRMPHIRYVIPRTPAARWLEDDDDLSVSEVARVAVLTVRRCGGAAPWAYVPFAYGWYAATDSLGRSIGGANVEMHINEADRLVRGYPTRHQIIVSVPTYDEYLLD